MKKLISNIKDSYNELVYKVSWPTKAELGSSAVVVMFASLLIAIVIFAMDSVFENLMGLLYRIF